MGKAESMVQLLEGKLEVKMVLVSALQSELGLGHLWVWQWV